MAKKRKMVRGTARKGGNPPKHTQFRKGTSGNPRGRPKGSKNLALTSWKRLATKLRDGRWEDSNDFKVTGDDNAARYQSRGRRSSGDG